MEETAQENLLQTLESINSPLGELKIVRRDEFKRRYNADAFKNAEGNDVLVLRQVEEAAKWGEGDAGELVRLEMDQDGRIISQKTITCKGFIPKNFEDVRGMSVGGRRLIGFTYLVSLEKEYIPFGAIAEIGEESSEVENLHVLTDLGPGKNVTPLYRNGTTIVFGMRQEGEENNRQLKIFSWDGEQIKDLQILEMPKDLPWAREKTGTTMPPIWVNENEALLIFHGLTRDESGRYIYSIGRAKLVKDAAGKLKIAAYDREPILTPDNFVDAEGKPLARELHDERRALYACGGIIEKNDLGQEILRYFVNVGDTETIEVQIPMEKLKAGLFEVPALIEEHFVPLPLAA